MERQERCESKAREGYVGHRVGTGFVCPGDPSRLGKGTPKEEGGSPKRRVRTLGGRRRLWTDPDPWTGTSHVYTNAQTETYRDQWVV